jgi:tRNA(adenine34) deaminase
MELLMGHMTNLDEKYMQVCIELAKTALSAGDPPVGAILVYRDEIIGRGIESGRSTGDITNHAEILAVRDAMSNGHSALLGQAVLYTTHEPCIMCSYVIRQSKIQRVVFGVAVVEVGGYSSEFPILKTDKIVKWGKMPQITSGVCQSECEKLNDQFRAARMKGN